MTLNDRCKRIKSFDPRTDKICTRVDTDDVEECCDEPLEFEIVSRTTNSHCQWCYKQIEKNTYAKVCKESTCIKCLECSKNNNKNPYIIRLTNDEITRFNEDFSRTLNSVS